MSSLEAIPVEIPVSDTVRVSGLLRTPLTREHVTCWRTALARAWIIPL